MRTKQQISMAVLAAASVAWLLPGLANAQSTYRSDRNGNPVYDNTDRRSNGRPGDYDRISGNLSTRQQRVSAGNTVTLAYSITNQGRDTRTYRFPSARMFDMEAVRVDVGANDRRGNNGGFGRGNNGGRRIVWRYSDGQLGAQMLSEFTLRPGQSRSFMGRWQVDRDVPAGTYEVTAFLTPQRENRTAVSTTRIIVENDGRGGRDRDNNWPGRGDDRGNGGWNDRNNDRNTVLDVTDIVRSNSNRYVDQRVTVRGIYRSNGSGNNSWLLDGDNVQALTVLGPTPRNARVNDRVTVSGTLRRSRTGTLTLQAD